MRVLAIYDECSSETERRATLEEFERRHDLLDRSGEILIVALQRLATLSPEAEKIVDDAFGAVTELR